jgi:hypothetical protein
VCVNQPMTILFLLTPNTTMHEYMRVRTRMHTHANVCVCVCVCMSARAYGGSCYLEKRKKNKRHDIRHTKCLQKRCNIQRIFGTTSETPTPTPTPTPPHTYSRYYPAVPKNRRQDRHKEEDLRKHIEAAHVGKGLVEH